MKKISTIILSLLFAAVFILPVFASAATSPGVKPGNFFYFFDTSFEKIGLFFTFSPEKKARRALQYADERLAEIEGIAEEKNTDAVKTAISNYENNVALAAEKSKEVTDKAKAESLLTAIEDNAEKNQEVLSVVLTKVPEEAREAILRAISASRRGQEEAAKQIIALKGEIEKLKQEVEELKAKDEEREKVIEELGKQKTEKSAIQPKTSAPASVAPTQKQEQAQTPPKTSIVTLPSGAVVEMDINNNILRYIKEASANMTSRTEALEIISVLVNVPPEQNSAKIEWQTNKPTESKVFISGGNLLYKKVFTSESGFSTRHITTVVGLARGFKFSYEIEAITADAIVAKKTGGFETEVSKPAEIKVYAWGDDRTLDNSRDSSIYVAGGGCETQYFAIAILDQYGDKMFGPEVTVTTPLGALTKTISRNDPNSTDEYGRARFWYTPTSTSTSEVITFKSGSLSINGAINIVNRLAELPPDRFKQTDDGGWIEVSSGTRVDIETKTCIIKQPLPLLR